MTFFLFYCPLINTPQGPYPIRVLVALAHIQSTLVLCRWLSCKLVLCRLQYILAVELVVVELRSRLL